MKVLLVGGGGREHALAWKLAREGAEVVAAPGNPGVAEVGRCVPVRADDLDALVALAEAERPDYTLVGPEAPLALGIVDRFRARGLPIFGPAAAAARIETSKAWAKRLMLDAGVPTARASTHTDAAEATHAARVLGAPVVVKASGLAAGKGVVVAQTLAEAEAAIDDMLVGNRYGAAGAEVLVEEFMDGEELSAFFITDGERAVALPVAQDHKRLLAGDAGPNTGGMGAYTPVTVAEMLPGTAASFAPGVTGTEIGAFVRSIVTSNDVTTSIELAVVDTTLAAMRAAGVEFTGLLYAGLMLTRDGWRVVEFNCRFGDPETQAVLPLCDRLGVAIGPMLAAVARGDRLSMAEPAYPNAPAAVTTVLAAAGYPDTPRTGDPITLPADLPDGVTIFHAGTARDASGQLVTAGGRVLAVTAVARTFEEAQALSRETAARVEFAGKQYRDDIGWREAERRKG